MPRQAAQEAPGDDRRRVHVGKPCPACQGRSKVVDTIHAGQDIIRYRKCRECGRRWQTVEQDAA